MMFGQKIQLAFIVIVMSAAGYFFYRNSQQSYDMSVNSWTVLRQHGLDSTKQITAANPADPKKAELVTGFGFSDGILEIVEFPNADPARSPTVKLGPGKRGSPRAYQYFHDPLAPVAKIKDPFRHALALATYHAEYVSSIGLLGKVDMTPDQRTKELDARNKMNAAMKVIDGAVESGSFHKELLDKVMAALKVYEGKNGDPTLDQAKAALARKVLSAAADYVNQQFVEKDKAIDIYMDVVAGFLSSDQQTKLIGAAKDYEDQQQKLPPTPRGRGRGVAPGGGGVVTFGSRSGPGGSPPPVVTTSPGRQGRGRGAPAPAPSQVSPGR